MPSTPPSGAEQAKQLAERVMASIERDLGVHVAAMFDQNPHVLTDEQLRAWGRFGSTLQFPNRCPECGQDLPDE